MPANLSRHRVYCVGSVNSKVIKFIYFLFSIFSLTVGFLIYYLFRKNNIFIYEWFAFLPKNNNILSFSSKSFLLDFLRYNLPDGLWLLSGLLFLRALWYEEKIFLIYKALFLSFAFLLETLQISDEIPGTFDFYDLTIMGSITLGESIVYKIMIERRQSCVKE